MCIMPPKRKRRAERRLGGSQKNAQPKRTPKKKTKKTKTTAKFGGAGNSVSDGTCFAIPPMEKFMKKAGLERLSMSKPKEVEAKAKKLAHWFNSGKGFMLDHLAFRHRSDKRDIKEQIKKNVLLIQFYASVNSKINGPETRAFFVRRFIESLEPDLRRQFNEMLLHV